MPVRVPVVLSRDEVARIAHRFVSTSGSVGAVRLARILREVEGACSRQRSDDALHRGTRQFHTLCNLTEAETCSFIFQRTQDRSRACNHLDLALSRCQRFLKRSTRAHRFLESCY